MTDVCPQVANKQGQYLASLFNKHHIGSLDNLRHGEPLTRHHLHGADEGA